MTINMRLKSLEEIVARQNYYGVSVPTFQSQQSHLLLWMCQCSPQQIHIPVLLLIWHSLLMTFLLVTSPSVLCMLIPFQRCWRTCLLNRQPPVGLDNIDNMLIQENKELYVPPAEGVSLGHSRARWSHWLLSYKLLLSLPPFLLMVLFRTTTHTDGTPRLQCYLRVDRW